MGTQEQINDFSAALVRSADHQETAEAAFAAAKRAAAAGDERRLQLYAQAGFFHLRAARALKAVA